MHLSTHICFALLVMTGGRAEAAAGAVAEEAPVPAVPSAPRQLHDWREAAGLLRARSVDLRVAAAETERARAAEDIAIAAVLPNFSATGTALHNQLTEAVPTLLGGSATSPSIGVLPVPTPNVAYVSAGASQSLIDLAAWREISAGAATVTAARDSQFDAVRVVVRGAADSVLAVLTAERVAALNRVGLRAALDRLALTERKQALGVANGLDIARAQRDVDLARATMVNGDESLRVAREALGLAVGVGGEVGVNEEHGAELWARDASASCAQAKGERTDVRAARAHDAAARRKLAEAGFRYFPTVSAQTTFSKTTDPVAIPSTTWSMQATVTVPIWDGGARAGAVRDARAQADEARARLWDITRQAQVDIERAARAVSVTSEERGIAAHARAVAETEDALTRQAFAAGQGTSLELVTAAAALREAEIQSALRDYDAVRATVDLALANASCTL